MQVLTTNVQSSYRIEQLARVFYPDATPRKNSATTGDLLLARLASRRLVAALRIDGVCHIRQQPRDGIINETAANRKLIQLVYELLCDVTDYTPPWGMLIGVRPSTLYRTSRKSLGAAKADSLFTQNYGVKSEKLKLLKETYHTQQTIVETAAPKDYCLYIDIPFCPSRCNYCTFVSASTERQAHLIEPYLEALFEELAVTAQLIKPLRLRLRAIYIGGGTPTVLDENQFERLLSCVQQTFQDGFTGEYTVEAGRPDCTTAPKLHLMKKYGVTRVSINPQSMCDEVLKKSNRRHTRDDVLRCFENAREAEHSNINMDLIAGLPSDNQNTFTDSLSQVLALQAENITLHTLTLKRASHFAAKEAFSPSSPSTMLNIAYPMLAKYGYLPYYLYRQKNTVDDLENTGWTVPGKSCLYNIYMMEELTSVIAVGAGSTTKLVNKERGKIERIFNFKYPTEYINRFDEIKQRKRGVERFYVNHLDT